LPRVELVSDSLFRAEALNHQRERLWGDVVLTQSVSVRVFTLVLVVAVIVVAVFLSVGTYTRKVTAQGFMRPETGLVQVYPTRPGYVTELFVRTGDIVEQHDPLMSINTSRTLEDGSQLGEVLIGLLGDERSSLQKRVERQQRQLVLERENLVNNINSLKQQLVQIERQQTLQLERVALTKSRYKTLSQMANQQLVAQEEVDTRYQMYLDTRQEGEKLRQLEITARSELGDAEYRLLTIDDTVQERVDELTADINRIDQQIARQSSDGAYVIRAPVSGRVTSLQFNLGNRIPIDRPLLAILPEGTELQIELLVPTDAIGFVTEGQVVDIRYDAFPYERFGSHEGHIEGVAVTALSPSELVAPVPTDRPVYLVTVKPQTNRIKAHGKTFPLQAGMTLSADIRLDNRPLYQWLLRPLLSLEGTL